MGDRCLGRGAPKTSDVADYLHGIEPFNLASLVAERFDLDVEQDGPATVVRSGKASVRM